MPLNAGENNSRDIEQLAEEFHAQHEKLYTFSMPWVPVELCNLRLIAKIDVKKIEVSRIAAGAEDASAAIKSKRLCFFNGGYTETPIYDSSRLKPGNFIPGPAVVEEPVTTLVIPGGFNCCIDEYGNYILRR
jgi:N-methylhydantoinase A